MFPRVMPEELHVQPLDLIARNSVWIKPEKFFPHDRNCNKLPLSVVSFVELANVMRRQIGRINPLCAKYSTIRWAFSSGA